MQTIKAVLLLLLAAIALGFGVNAVRSHPLPMRYEKPGAKPAVAPGVTVAEPGFISLQELRDAPKESVVIIDARTPLFFKAGHINKLQIHSPVKNIEAKNTINMAMAAPSINLPMMRQLSGTGSMSVIFVIRLPPQAGHQAHRQDRPQPAGRIFLEAGQAHR